MARMECDTPHVAKRIVALVIDSFQGTKVDLSKQVPILIPSSLPINGIPLRLIGVYIYFKHTLKQRGDFTN